MSEPDKGQPAYLFAGFATLFVVSFLDNARGPLLPVLCQTLKIPYETAGLFLTVGSLAAVLGTFVLGRCLKRWGERDVSIWACFISTLPGLFAPYVSDRLSLLLLGVMLGAAVALVGSLCSILSIKGSPPSKRGRYLSFQQVMYGVGSLTAPLVFQALVRLEMPWWWLLRCSAIVLFALGLGLIVLLPKNDARAEETDEIKGKLGRRGRLVVATFSLYVAGEVLASVWMTSLLVGSQARTPVDAAKYLMGFFVMIAITRFLCFLFVRPHHEGLVLLASVAAAIVFSILGQQGYSWALPAIGILGPFFPLFMARISQIFPNDWRQVTIYVYLGIQSMLAIMHLSVGKVADTLGIQTAFLLSPGFLALSLVLLWVLLRIPPDRSPEELHP